SRTSDEQDQVEPALVQLQGAGAGLHVHSVARDQHKVAPDDAGRSARVAAGNTRRRGWSYDLVAAKVAASLMNAITLAMRLGSLSPTKLLTSSMMSSRGKRGSNCRLAKNLQSFSSSS